MLLSARAEDDALAIGQPAAEDLLVITEVEQLAVIAAVGIDGPELEAIGMPVAAVVEDVRALAIPARGQRAGLLRAGEDAALARLKVMGVNPERLDLDTAREIVVGGIEQGAAIGMKHAAAQVEGRVGFGEGDGALRIIEKDAEELVAFVAVAVAHVNDGSAVRCPGDEHGVMLAEGEAQRRL